MKKLGIVIIMAVIAAVTVQAETLALWENDNLIIPANSTPADFAATGVFASDLALGAGLPPPATTWPNALDGGIHAHSTNLTAAIALNHYFTFTVTPDAGKQVDYSNVAARVTLNALTNVGTSVQMVLMSSATGFTDGDEIGFFMAATTNADATDNGLIDIDVSGVAALQDQPSPVEFRLYGVLAGTEGSYNRLALGHIYWVNGEDDVRVDGTVEDATSLPIVELAKWDLDGLVGSSSTASVDVVHADMSSTDLTAGAGLATGIGWSHSIGCYAEGWRLSSSLEYAISQDNYFSFTVSPDAGKMVGFDNLFTRFSVNTGSSTCDVTFLLLSDKTGFSTNGILGAFNVTDDVPNYSPTTYTHDFDLSAVPELQDLTESTEFRIYVTSVSGNRMGIGQAFTLDSGADDLRVEGTLEDAPYSPATIVDWTFVSGSVMKLVVDAPSDPEFYYPKGSTNLVAGFSGVAHADSAGGPFDTITNLTVSAAEGDNLAIFVEATEAAKFFKIGQE